MKLLKFSFVFFLAGQIVGIALANSKPKSIDDKWTWFEDYAFAYAEYTVACEPGRQCQVGTGMFLFGEPRGEKNRFSGEREITVFGFGAIHIRVVDGKGKAMASFAPGARKGFSATFNW